MLDPETAKEVARLRADKEFGAQRQQAATQAAQQRVFASIVKGLNDWDTAKRSSDPDYDKKAELVRGVFTTLIQGNLPQSPEACCALAEKAYATVNERLAKFVPPNGARKVLTSTQASTKTIQRKPTTTREAVDQMLREKHGISLEEETE